jgi:hypothetical protein
MVLHWPQTNYLYFGSSNGRLYQINFGFAPGHPDFAKFVTLGDGTGLVGAPTLDIGVNPRLLVVGSEAGIVYGVEVPF